MWVSMKHGILTSEGTDFARIDTADVGAVLEMIISICVHASSSKRIIQAG
jgi:hypothetical protein